MCGRYVVYDTDNIEDRFNVEVNDDLAPNYNVAPGQTMPVITQDGLVMMRWGLIPRWAKDEKVGYKMINARSETVFEKATWKGLITRKKCLIPANGFYEWQKREDGKQPFYIHLKDEKLFAFAGLWEMWEHQGKAWHTYTILTTTPNTEMSAVHDRMPVILHKEDEAQWLYSDTQVDVESLLNPYANGELAMDEVSRDVNTVKTNDGKLILPINSR